MAHNINREKFEVTQELYVKMQKLDTMKLKILDARVDQMLLDHEEICSLRAKLELATALLEAQKPA